MSEKDHLLAEMEEEDTVPDDTAVERATSVEEKPRECQICYNRFKSSPLFPFSTGTPQLRLQLRHQVIHRQ